MVWVIKFKLKDDKDVYSPVCRKMKVEFFAFPYTQFVKNRKIHLLVGGILSGSEENKERFVEEIKKDSRVESVERHHDHIFIHTIHPITRESKAEVKIFYNPQFIRVKPVHVSSDGWEYWEVACLEREELNKLFRAAKKYYHGELFFIKKEKMKGISILELTFDLTEKQLGALQIALKEGYYTYPRTLTLPAVARMVGKSYSTFQEHLRKAEGKLVTYFLKYR